MIIARIHNNFKNLTETEQKIASYVLSCADKVTGMTAKELATECNTVPSAVIRFCKSLQCEGFSEFKILLARELGSSNTDDISKLPAFEVGDDSEVVFQKVFASGISTLQDTIKMIDFSVVKNITRVISKANRIFIFGIGTSSVVAIDAQYRFAQLGFNVTSCTDVVFMNVAAYNLKEGDVAIGISHSGRTKAVVDSMRRAKESGATTVAITSFEHSPLANESDYSISVFADEENYPVEAVSARVAHICLIDAFMMTLATLDYEEFEKHVTRRNRVLGEIRY